MNQLAPIADAQLPASYANAKAALANCASLDECQDWADKAAALASYAKQANDDEMMKMAIRIRDRALRRSGELLKQIEPNKGGRPSETSGDAPTSLTRKAAATDAGMSRDQMHTALRIANVPADQFDELVESDTPPTATKLAAMGTKPAPRPVIDLQGRDPGEFNRSLHFIAEFEDYARTISALNIDAILPTLVVTERMRVKTAIAKIDSIHDRIITRI